MPKIILFSDYIKPNKRVHLNNVIDYIALRNTFRIQETEVDFSVTFTKEPGLENLSIDLKQFPPAKEVELEEATWKSFHVASLVLKNLNKIFFLCKNRKTFILTKHGLLS